MTLSRPLLIPLLALAACGNQAPPPYNPVDGTPSQVGRFYEDLLAQHDAATDSTVFAHAVLEARGQTGPSGLYPDEQYHNGSFTMPLYMELADAAKALTATGDPTHLRAAWLIAMDFGAGPSAVEVRQSMRIANAILDASPPHDLLADIAAHDFNAAHGVAMMLRHEAMWIRAGTFPEIEGRRPRRADADALDAVADCLDSSDHPSACFADADFAKRYQGGVLRVLEEQSELRGRLDRAGNPVAD